MKRGQVWIETVIYTLIALTMIAVVLGYVRPKIAQMQDRAIIEQSISLMKDIDSELLTMGGAGNQRILEIGIRQGRLIIDGVKDRLIFEMDSASQYSEPGKVRGDGNLNILTQSRGNYNNITITRDYINEYNLTYQLTDTIKTIEKSTSPYKLRIYNRGQGKFNTTSCTDISACSDITGYSKDCVNINSTIKNCQYTENRLDVNFEVS